MMIFNGNNFLMTILLAMTMMTVTIIIIIIIIIIEIKQTNIERDQANQ